MLIITTLLKGLEDCSHGVDKAIRVVAVTRQTTVKQEVTTFVSSIHIGISQGKTTVTILEIEGEVSSVRTVLFT